jgi:three-Cys-motif partner protein
VPHKADPSFFEKKRDWSKRKDLILAYYLKPYLAKVGKLRRPILIVDGFAGPGRYGDGTTGSPLIICSAVQAALSYARVPISVLCVEEDDDLHQQLAALLSQFPFAATRHTAFLEALPEVERLAQTHTVFLYVDPYAIEGLQWEAMDRIFRHVQDSKSSVEVLLNFSAGNFARRGLAALQLQHASVDDDVDSSDGESTFEEPSILKLNEVAGGDWWQEILRRNDSFAKRTDAIANEFCRLLSTRFREVCSHPVRAKFDDQVPKYSLVFGSRSSDALILMNDAMIKSRNILAESAKPESGTLFETRPTELVPDPSILPNLILQKARERKKRRDLIVEVIRQQFCAFSESEIRQAVHALLKEGKLKSSTGQTRINDSVEIWSV